MKTEIVVDSPEALAGVFAERFAKDARAAIAENGRFSCALPGGSVAETFFPVLAQAPVEWAKVDFFWGDERAVGPDDPDSNYGLAKRLLLDAIGAAPDRVHRMRGEDADLEASARSYERELVRVLGEPPRIDWIVLGLGPEGHVCSLFPNHPLLHERTRLVSGIDDSPKPPPRRITLTMLALEMAGAIVVAGFGASKAEAIRDAVAGEDSQIPVALAVRRASRALVLVDPPAAALIPPPRG
jgi:6-phosphogluconolactonase